MTGLVVGDDGLARCGWAVNAPDYVAYHDDEWGRHVHGERALFERITLEAFQSGLSWLTILRRREGFRAAFAHFDPEPVAQWGTGDVARLMGDASIIRNQAKIRATIQNARAVIGLRERGGLDELVWAHAPAPRPRRLTAGSDVPAITPESTALSRTLKGAGFAFVGPTTAYAAMQACGLVDDHIEGCHVTGWG